MNDYIKREDMIKNVCQKCRDVYGTGCDMKDECAMYARLLSIPAADVVERKHGKWIYQFYEGEVGVTCSECEGYAESFARWIYDEGYRIDYNFCPNCGARMVTDDA